LSKLQELQNPVPRLKFTNPQSLLLPQRFFLFGLGMILTFINWNLVTP